MTPELHQLLTKTDAWRRAGDWQNAAEGYQTALVQLPKDAVVAHNLALCHLALGDNLQAQTYSSMAMRLNPQQWQSGLIQAKALIANGQKTQALELLESLAVQQPTSADVVLELAKLVMQHGGDAAQACSLVQPFLGSEHRRDAQIVSLIAQLYDRDSAVAAQTLSQDICKFADVYLQLPSLERPSRHEVLAVGKETRSRQKKTAFDLGLNRRLRVGLLSPQFSVSPVYFFTYGSLSLMVDEVDFVFFSRAKKNDWATRLFQAFATDWVDVSLCTAEQLARVLVSHDLDVLVDMGGWMDPVGLQALSIKPARKMFKWVGGQSATTGLRTFDGFLSDRYQTPKGSDSLYSEPLIRLESGYVTYTPPPYLPQPVKRVGSMALLGVIANPAKVSRAFLAELRQSLTALQKNKGGVSRAVHLYFIDKRYQQPVIRERIQTALPGVSLEFVTPADHLAYLTAVSRLDATLDTWPYSGGLTAIEALALGVPSYTRAGQLFCERHTVSHYFYAGLKIGHCTIDGLDGLLSSHGSNRRTLLSAQSPRLDHVALANELLYYFHVT